MKQKLMFFAALIPPLFLGIAIWRYGVNIPFWDQWETPGQLLFEASQSKLSFAQWMRQHNESRTLVFNFIFLTLADLTNWNTKYEMLITFLLACLVSLNIYCLSRNTLGKGKSHSIAFLLANLLIFSPIQYENWLWGFQGIAFSTITAITSSLVIINSRISWVFKLIFSTMLATLATFSFANGALAWIIIFPALFLKSIRDNFSRTKVVLSWLFATTATMTIYLHGYSRSSDLPSITQVFTNPNLSTRYYSSLLGSPIFPRDLIGSQITGAILLVIFICFCFYLLKQPFSTIFCYSPWILIGFFTLFSASLTTAGRMSLGLEFSLSSRYITFTNYFIISLIYLFTLFLSQAKREIWQKIAICMLTILLIITCRNNFVFGTKVMTRSYYQRSYGKTCLLAIDLVRDEKCLTTTIHPIASELEKKARRINSLALIQPGLLSKIEWQTNSINSDRNLENKYGEITKISLKKNGDISTSGHTFAKSSKYSLDAVILAYQTKDKSSLIPFAIAELNVDSKDIWQLLVRSQNVKLSWSKTITKSQLPPHNSKISAWGFDTNDGKAYPLQNKAGKESM